jgi:hypothetical protein
MMEDNYGYLFSIDRSYYAKSNGYSEMHDRNIIINLASQTSDDIEAEIISQINMFLETCNVGRRFSTSPRKDEIIYINWIM